MVQQFSSYLTNPNYLGEIFSSVIFTDEKQGSRCKSRLIKSVSLAI